MSVILDPDDAQRFIKLHKASGAALSISGSRLPSRLPVEGHRGPPA